MPGLHGGRTGDADDTDRRRDWVRTCPWRRAPAWAAFSAVYGPESSRMTAAERPFWV